MTKIIKVSGDVAGLDIGSRSIELVVLKDGEPVYFERGLTAYDPIRNSLLLLNGVVVERLVVTGYGRKLFLSQSAFENVEDITEIQAYAIGVRSLFPEARTILDIGGQDTKAICLSEQGKVLQFEMNDRCAAGTGKFLEHMAMTLDIPLEQFGDFALAGDKRVPIGSMCTVFAETEATSLMAAGERPENIALGLHEAIVQRSLKMLSRVGLKPPLVFAGGGARNRCMQKLLQEKTKEELLVPKEPEMAGALGAAIYADKN